MKVVFHDGQRAHNPASFIVSGTIRPNPEQPARIDALMGAVARMGLAVVEPTDHGLGPIAAVHKPDYLSFLKTIHGRWREIDGASDQVAPNVHPNRVAPTYPQSLIGQAGWHMADTACPIAAETWGSALWSAHSAVTGADLVLGGDAAAYALCRPPGHHAYPDMAGGFCLLCKADCG